jgi:HAD superfamily hydrolase (TIGR01549 family)
MPHGPLVSIVFDMDGTLIDSQRAVATAYRAAVLAGGGAEPADSDIVAAYPLGPPAVILTHLLRRAATDRDLERYHEELRAQDVLVYEGIADAVLRAARCAAIGIFTGSSRRAAMIMLGRAGLLGHFPAIVGGDEVTTCKPAPDGIYLICRRLGVEPARTAYVGDSPLDLEAARRSGALAVAAAWGHQYDPAIPADETVHHPLELLDLLVAPGQTRHFTQA